MREALHDLAEHMGVSMIRLAQDAIAAQLGLTTTTIVEARLEQTLAALRAYNGGWSDEEIALFARGEVEREDPAEGCLVEPVHS
jgi:hypothetical protein